MKLENLGIFEISKKIKAGELKAEEVTEAFLSRSKTLNSKLNAFITMNDRALEQAKKIDLAVSNKKALGLLAGVPIAVKDLLCTKGLRTTAASKILGDFSPTYSATVVSKLEDHGGIVIGKTNLDEFAMGSSNENSAFGCVKNPWDLERVPGGSSGGSAVAVAAQLAPGAIGTDTGGSIRQPASFCGIVGMKPTYGRVSRFGIIAFASSLDQAGPMAGDIRDTALLLEAMSGHDLQDSTSADVPVPNYSEKLSDDLRGLRIGIPKEYFAEGVDGEILKTVKESLEVLKSRGAQLIDVTLPSVKYALSIYYLVATSEASSNLSRYDGIRFGMRAREARDIDEVYKFSRGEGFGPEVKRRIMLGTYSLSSGYYEAFYTKACQARRIVQKDFLNAFTKCDVLVSPVTPVHPFKIGEQVNDPLAMYLSDILTISTNLAGLPGMSVPGGYSSGGLPIGVQITGRHFEEQTLLNVGYCIEKNLGLPKRSTNV